MSLIETDLADADWVPDELLPGYQCATIALPDAKVAPGEPEDTELVATLVRPSPFRHDRAVLYVHGWADYFFQTHLAEFFDAQGWDFVAIELRRYGRSLREGQLAGFSDDLDEYATELDAAAEMLRQGHSSLVVVAHSTGGLIASLWAAERPGLLDAVVLNSPWLDLQGWPLLAALSRRVVSGLAARSSSMVLPLPDSGVYARSINAELGGEWTFDLGLKQHASFQVRAGWLQAVIAGQDRVKRGLGIDVPILMLICARSDFRRTWDDALMTADTVLDVTKLAKRAPQLGRHVTLVRVTDGLHDLVLSAEPVRAIVFDEMARFLRCYVEAPRSEVEAAEVPEVAEVDAADEVADA